MFSNVPQQRKTQDQVQKGERLRQTEQKSQPDHKYPIDHTLKKCVMLQKQGKQRKKVEQVIMEIFLEPRVV